MTVLTLYKRHPKRFLEITRGLPFEDKAAFSLIVDFIYLNDGIADDDAELIAGMLGLSPARWESIRGRLLGRKKIKIHRNLISILAVDEVLKDQFLYREAQSKKRLGRSKNKGLESRLIQENALTVVERLPLPGTAGDLAKVIGRDKTLFLIGQLKPAGNRSWRRAFYVPATLPKGHWLEKLLGEDLARKLCREFGGLILQPSNCQFLRQDFLRRSVHRLDAAGRHKRDIARTLECSERYVVKVLKSGERPPKGNP